MKRGCISLGGEDLIWFNEHRNTGKIWNYVFMGEIILEWKNGLMLFFGMFGVGGFTNQPSWEVLSIITGQSGDLATIKNGVDHGLVVEHSCSQSSAI